MATKLQLVLVEQSVAVLGWRQFLERRLGRRRGRLFVVLFSSSTASTYGSNRFCHGRIGTVMEFAMQFARMQIKKELLQFASNVHVLKLIKEILSVVVI